MTEQRSRVLRQDADGEWVPIGFTNETFVGFDPGTDDPATDDEPPVIVNRSDGMLSIHRPFDPRDDDILRWLRGPRRPGDGGGAVAMTITTRGTSPVVPRTGKRPPGVTPAQWRARLRLATLARRRRRRAGLPLTTTTQRRTVLPNVRILAERIAPPAQQLATQLRFTTQGGKSVSADEIYRAARINRIVDR